MKPDRLMKSECYVTSDLYYAAYLRVAGVSFVGSEREGDRLWFLFQVGPSIKHLKDEYYAKTARVPAFDYAQMIRTMKSLTRL